MDINKVTLIGRLTRDPEKRTTKGGSNLVTFSVATNYMWRDQKTKEKKDKTEFHRVVVWGHLAEIAGAYLKKASRIYIEGRMQYHAWTDKQNQKRISTDIVADEIVMLGHNGSSAKNENAFVKEEPSEAELVVEEA